MERIEVGEESGIEMISKGIDKKSKDHWRWQEVEMAQVALIACMRRARLPSDSLLVEAKVACEVPSEEAQIVKSSNRRGQEGVKELVIESHCL